MWAAIFLGFGIACIAGFVFLWKQFQKFGIIQKLSGGKKWLQRLLALIPLALMGIYFVVDAVPAAVALVHLIVVWLVFAGMARLIGRKQERVISAGHIGVWAMLVTGLYLTYAWYTCVHVVETDYELTTDKLAKNESYRVVQITDAHLGTTFDGDEFWRYVGKINDLRPDVVVITGDFVDDSTKKIDLEIACQALGALDAPGGIFYVYGNHDKGYGRNRDFSADDLKRILQGVPGLTILEDEQVTLCKNENLVLVGRQDRSVKNRASIDTMMQKVEDSAYTIVLDHQPNDQKAEMEASCDLVLSGHTHGGQLLPINYMGELFGLNDQTKGLRQRENTTFIVSSGISDWALPFKTGCVSEYVVIDIKGTR